MAGAPAWASLPVIGMVQINAANTARDGTGTLGTLLTGDSTGTVIARFRIVGGVNSGGSTTAGMIRFFLDDGTNKRLIYERRVTAITPTATVKCYEDEFEVSDLGLKDAAWSVKVSTEKAETFNVFALGGKI